MQSVLRTLREKLEVGLVWGALWTALMFLVGTILGAVRPESIDRGEEPHVLAPMVGLVGLLCGVVFAAIVSGAEDRKPLHEIPLARAAMWGALVAGPLPLLTGADTSMVFITGPLGAVSALASVALLRARARRPQARPSADASSS
ncbi:MAG: hypothetical protein ACREOU_09455 [Candidatus Eiseniibacteriota bacterium]